MAVGPKDSIDRLLVKKYQAEKVDNPTMTKLIDSQKMLETMNDYALMHRNMLALNDTLQKACAAINSKTAVYKTRKRVSAAS
ncbi:MAG: hypothetical protein PHV37_07560 [Candidatus Gastranaerophilales bacterium]|nr:hypothetical protein [Candidatus Gastranaerophilales bacterium]